MNNKIYIIKNLSPWMMDELLAFANITDYSIIFLREQKNLYSDDLAKLKDKGINIIDEPYNFNNFYKKLLFILAFFLRNLNRFTFGYSGVIGAMSIYWFLRLDMSYFKEPISIHSQFATQASIVSMMLKDYYGEESNYSFTFHAHDIYFNNKWFSKLVNNSSVSISISEFNVNFVKANYDNLNYKKIKISRLGVSIPEVIEQEKNTKESTFNLGFLSWFVEKKGIFYLLRAIKHFRNSDIKLILAGDGPLKEKILLYIKNNNLEKNVKYIGEVRGEQKSDFYNSLDAFILPSITLANDMDGIPVVLMEAISYGLPIISTSVSGIPEICRGEYNGLLIREKKSSDIVDAIEFLYKKDKKRKAFGRKSRELSKNYDIVKNSNKKAKILGWI
ncbi:MAG: glycosyltransferase family 4 protein [Bacteroidales bacterium]|nr:glycosyltransferase family 4 protein [Bacteroidales bacterium]